MYVNFYTPLPKFQKISKFWGLSEKLRAQPDILQIQSFNLRVKKADSNKSLKMRSGVTLEPVRVAINSF
jgi:hypothetical protein